MVLGAHGVRITGLALVFVAVASCGGERVRLGDAIGEDDTTDDAGQAEGGGGTTRDGSADDRPESGAGDGNTPCGSGRVNPNAVVWIGDSWVTVPGVQHTRVRDLARASGAMGPSDDYVVLAAPSTSMSMIADQYSTREAGAIPVQVLIMDGGTWDTLTAGGTDSSVAKAVGGFKQLLSKVASDHTVQNIIYFLQPELPSIPGVAALRPQLMQACDESTVPCYFIDLQPLWAGHPEYTAGDGVQSSTAGATVIADQIWATMREHCIAQ
jgi:hypothetical protein